jgi:uncharacterized membrane protein
MTTMETQKPDLRPMLIFSAAVVGLMFALSAYAWARTPPGGQLPTHWNAAGEVDGYGSKFTALMLLPLTTAGIAILLAFVPRMDPRGDNILRSWEAYRVTWLGAVLFFAFIHVGAVLTILGLAVNFFALLVPVGTGLLLMVIGNYLGKIRPNYMFGVRLPWTLASELSWNKTHRFAGRLFVAIGALTVLAAVFVPGSLWVWVMLGGLLLMLVATGVYSDTVWRDDPARRPL